MTASGVEGQYGRCASEDDHALGPAQLAALAPAFGATHVLVLPQGAAYEEMLARWPVVYESGGTMRWAVAENPRERRP